MKKYAINCKKSVLLLVIPTSYVLVCLITPPQLQQLTSRLHVHGDNEDGMKDTVRTLPAPSMDSGRGELADINSSLVHTDSILTDSILVNEQSYSPVEEVVNRCMKATNIGGEKLSRARYNARYFYNEFRRGIPLKGLSGYSSHCWKVSYFAQWAEPKRNGHIGSIKFKIGTFDTPSKSWLTEIFPFKKVESDMVCLPNLFLAGFSKCGSSFLYCLINKLLNRTTYNFIQPQKESFFWVRSHPVKTVFVPTVNQLGRYILNFMPSLEDSANRAKAMLIDGTPNTLLDWPRFRQSEHNLTNYCLIPSVLPNLLPDSKYIVIMRNPVDMMYSSFWFSCTKTSPLPMQMQLRGPYLFHVRVKTKIEMFNNCMKDSSAPLLSQPCGMDSKHSYSACITKRLHLLDKCVHQITINLFSRELPNCGHSRIAMGIYFVHVRKWLSVVAKDRFLFLTLEDIAKNTTQGVLSVLKYLGLRTSNDYKISGEVAASSCDTYSQSRVNYKQDPRLQMRADTRGLLEIFFHPFNILLSELLNRTTLWNSE